MFNRFQQIELLNVDKLMSVLQDHEHIYNVDMDFSDKVHLDVTNFKVYDNEQDQLSVHMLVSRMIAQIALNRHNNKYYYKAHISYYDLLIQSINDEDSRRLYEELMKVLSQKDCCTEDLLIIIQRSIIIYLITSKVLRIMENSKICSENSYDKRNEITDDNAKDLKSNVRVYPKDNTSKFDGEGLKSLMSTNSKNEHQVVEEWTCGKCTMVNVYEDELCKACRECGPHYDKWRCGQCTMINDKREEICSACNKWSPFMRNCPHCHVRYINTVYDNECAECLLHIQNNEPTQKVKFDIKLNTEIASKSQEMEKWLCSNCSNSNKFKDVKCLYCENVGPHYHKWRCKCTELNSRRNFLCKRCGVSSIKKYIKSFL